MRARVLTALALIPPVLLTLMLTSSGPLFFVGLLLALIGATEIARMTYAEPAAARPTPMQVATTVSALILFALPTCLVINPFAHQVLYHRAPLTILAMVSFALSVAGVLAVHLRKPALAPIAAGWISGPLLAIVALHVAGNYGGLWNVQTPVLLAIVPLWAGDTAAIFAGKAFGKHPLAPKISPKKTVEGGVANLIACMLAAWGLGAWIGIPLPQSLACGAAAGILGQCGDLFESSVKRKAGLKDSGTILPGHGGIMDRIDSILFTAPAVALILFCWTW